jgi:hypothetical protein
VKTGNHLQVFDQGCMALLTLHLSGRQAGRFGVRSRELVGACPRQGACSVLQLSQMRASISIMAWEMVLPTAVVLRDSTIP